ncbi:MAG: hypothetical protein H0T50_13100 [Gemmatimonadales bacterium]|nr:hypothetical protein [Gemmatimonadales bacterium]
MRALARIRPAGTLLSVSMLILPACRDNPGSPTGPGPAPAVATAASAPLTFRQVSGGSSYNCGLTADGVVYCWGVNNLGQLGDGTLDDHPTPAPISGGRRFRQVDAGGGHACGIATDDRTYCWGWNNVGQLGDGTRADRSLPTAVVGAPRFRQLSAGIFHTCGVTPNGRVYCWGINKQGQLGDGSDVPRRLEPVQVATDQRFRVVSVGGSHTCGITLDDRAFCWGHGKSGELGNGRTLIRKTPTAVAGGLRFREIAAGETQRSGNWLFTCGITTEDRAYCWGGNLDGQLGDGTITRRLRPAAVAGGLRFSTVSAGGSFTCGVTTANAAYCWGRDDHGQLGDGGPTGDPNAKRLSPVPVTGGLALTAVSAGWLHTCGVATDGAAHCWGSNFSGELGDGTEVESSVPVAVLGPS